MLVIRKERQEAVDPSDRRNIKEPVVEVVKLGERFRRSVRLLIGVTLSAPGATLQFFNYVTFDVNPF